VSAPVVEEAVIESVRRFAVQPEVIKSIARAARQRLNEELGRHREELKAPNVRVRNATSQLVLVKNLEPGREAALGDVVSSGESKGEQLRALVERGERLRFDNQMVRQRMATFDEV
jgi:hypothetical protein